MSVDSQLHPNISLFLSGEGPDERKGKETKESEPRRHFRLTKAEGTSIKQGLDGRESARSMARGLGRSQPTVANKARRNRTVAKGPGKGGRAEDVPQDVCPRLLRWPHVCNGGRARRLSCSRRWRCGYSAARAQAHRRRGALGGAPRRRPARRRNSTEPWTGSGPTQLETRPRVNGRGRACDFAVIASTIYR